VKSEWTVSTLKEHFEALLAERDKALVGQHREYERRLDELNHAHQRAVEVQHTYVTDEKFEAFVERYGENRDATATALNLAAGSKQGVTATGRVIVTAVTLAATVITAVVILANVLTHS
jgi:hypothetical protein